MKLFQALSLKRKIIGIVMLASGVALLLATSAFVSYELTTYRETAVVELATTAQMIANTSTAALAFSDTKAAAETLATLRGEARIVEAGIYRRDGTQLASYVSDRTSGPLPAAPGADGPRFEDGRLLLFQRVSIDGDRIGTVYLKSDLRDMYARLERYALIAGAVLIVSLLTALLISSLLQRLISRPILQLADTAGRVSRENNYLLRAEKLGEDEIGALVDQFNGMMDQIHGRDLALQAARDELEDRVEDRTRQLQIEIAERKSIEKDLIGAKNAAEASSRAKSVFLANMSHELRTPLNAIIGYSEMLQEDAELAGQSGMIPDLKRIHGAGKHLLSLINDVLDLSKIEAGRMEIHPERFEVGTLVDDAHATTEPLARKNGNRLVVKCEDRRAAMYTDLIKFRQSLLNLLSNACKFTENGTITLEVRQTAIDGREWFEWAVSDTGIGIPSEQMHKLFRSFSQVDSSSTRKHGGTGLGLNISQRLCELMGGSISAESEPGVGSRFTIRLPVALPGADSHHTTPAPAAALTRDEHRDTILVIDDDPAVQDLLTRNLEKNGFRVVVASDGQDGLNKAKECSPAAIVLDILMPGLDGWTVFRKLRADPTLSDVPILVHTITDNRSLGAELGAAEYLQKPVAVEQLVAVLKKHSSVAPDHTPAAGEPLSVAHTVRSTCPELFEPAAAFSALARLAEISEERISLDLKLVGNSGRELFDQLVKSQDWQRVSIVLLPSPEDRTTPQLARLAVAIDPPPSTLVPAAPGPASASEAAAESE
jgi:signal transduction histidine kinase/FixJ family two-component response regulator